MSFASSSKPPGSLWGGMLLIAGSCIGAGMLALPIMTGLAGFFPSMVLFFIAWIFMTSTGLLLVEVNGWHKRPVNLLTMVTEILGRGGRIISWFLYLLLFYSLLVAYMSGSGNHVQTFSEYLLPFTIPDWSGTLFFVLFFGWIIFLGTRSVDFLNRFLMLGKIGFFLLLIVVSGRYIQPKLLMETKSQYALIALPVLITSFGFHNMIPTLTNYMKGDIQRVKKAIIMGSFLTLCIYLIWEIIALSILPIEGKGGIIQSYLHDIDAAQAIKYYLQQSIVGYFAQSLAFFAILTSLLAQSLSLSHFLADGFKLPHGDRENPWMCLLALVPPLIFTMIWPQLFFSALSFAGGFCAVILFGILPALMVWIGRYRQKKQADYQVRGGRIALAAISLFALFVFIYQVSSMLGWPLVKGP
ncbi:MAG: aromatic amino acid transport family protein [Simkaniaceae bacterium]